MSAEVQDRLKTLAGAVQRAGKHPHDAEAIHKLRVAIRRFTQALRVFRDSIDPAHRRKIRRRLRKLMDPCGAARNCDVAPEVLEAAGVPADTALRHRLHRQRSRAERELVKLLADGPTRTDLRRWHSWLPKTGGGPSHDLLAKLARDFARTGAAAARAGASFTQMHAFRLLVKRYRYTLEILKGSESRLETLRHLQEQLGAINDCVTTGELIAECGVKGAELRRIRAALNHLLERRTAEFRVYWKKKTI
jgi:CHAD domain-containing protein